MPAFLLEIGLEEIPAGMTVAAQSDMETRFRALIQRERLASADFSVKSYSTPRRLAIVAEGLVSRQADLEEEVVGPSVKVAYKDGAPTPAAIAFAKKSGVEVGALRSIQNAKGEYVAATVRRTGRSAADVLTAELPAEIAGISWPKSMYWRSGKPERFVRPVRWLLALLDEEILPLNFAGVSADGVSYGHRVLHGDAPVVVRKPQDYVEKLANAFVQVDPAARKHRIREALDAATRQIPGARWHEDEVLVDTVTNLTEWPSVILGNFDPLGLPKEVLITVMRDHQKYFALEDAAGTLLPHFLAVLNIEVDAAGADVIRHGNERVLRARFNDARFFWDVDQKISLVDRVEMLKHVTFQKDLGTYWDKTQLNVYVAQKIAQDFMGTAEKFYIEPAIHISKADLTCEMVKEFPELQGIVGGLYARAQGHPAEVAEAIYEQYRPQGPKDAIPETEVGAVVALADKMATISEMFKKNIIPTGSKDPFALRRAGAGVIRILAENQLVRTKLHLSAVVDASFAPSGQYPIFVIRDFMLDRLESYLLESRGISRQVARAIRNSGAAALSRDRQIPRFQKSLGYGHVVDFADALHAMVNSQDILALAELHKRASNILRQAEQRGIDLSESVSDKPLHEPAELRLRGSLDITFSNVSRLVDKGDYPSVFTAIISLREPMHQFFESVMVLTDNLRERQARLTLMSHAKQLIGWPADFSELASLQ